MGLLLLLPSAWVDSLQLSPLPNPPPPLRTHNLAVSGGDGSFRCISLHGDVCKYIFGAASSSAGELLLSWPPLICWALTVCLYFSIICGSYRLT